MEKANFGQIVSFLFGIANDCLVDTYDVGDYRKIILPMMVIRRFDAVLEPTKEKVLKMKEQLDAAGITDQDEALCSVAGEAFCNSSPYTLSDLKSRTNQQQLKSDFILYLNGFSQNVQDIIKRFEFRNQIDKLSEHDILGLLISKFTDSSVNLSNRPICDAKGNVIQPALDNHTMGTVFEEVIRKFNEETNITDAGRHFTPRDIVELITDLAFVPVKDKIQSTTYRIYDGACGTGGMLTVAEGRVQEVAKEFGKNVSIHLYGQENSDETYAIARSDMLVKGEGVQANNIFFGSTISNDGFSGETFDFMLSNPPFGTPWKTDLKAWGDIKKDEITDTRFRVNYKGEDFSLIPDIGDPQMLFLANNISKMKKNTALGSRIVEVHSGSALFSGKAGQGPSNLRQYILEQDLLEAVVALPEKMFYNTKINTFLLVLANKKEDRRKGKVQLIDATSFKKNLKKNLGEKNGEITKEIREEILKLYTEFDKADSSYSRVFDNSEFGYWEVPVYHPQLDENGSPVLDSKGKYYKPVLDKEQVPFNYEGGIAAYIENEVKPFSPLAFIKGGDEKVGYEIRFTRYFKSYVEDVDVDVLMEQYSALQEVLSKQVDFIKDNPYADYVDINEIWLSSIPSHWEDVKIKHLFRERIEKGYPNEPLLAATQNMGVVPKDVYGQRTVEATKDLHLLKLVKVDDFVISLRSFQGGIERAYYRGIISPAYTVLEATGITVEYFKHLAKSKVFIELLKMCVTGIREGQNINYDMLKNVRIPVPPVEEQLQIAKFLDSIDARIDARRKEIALLEKYKKAITSNVVVGKMDVRNIDIPDYSNVPPIIEEESEEVAEDAE